MKEYEIRCMSTKQGFKVMDLFNTDETEAKLEMLKSSVYLDGKLLGDKVLDIPFKDSIKLIDEVLSVNGLGEDTEGKN